MTAPIYTLPRGNEAIPGEPMSLGTSAILEEATRLGMKYREIPGTRIFELKFQDQTRYFRRRIPSTTTDLAYYACMSKIVTRQLLLDKNITIPGGFVITAEDTPEKIAQLFETLSKPLVVKPTHASHGDGVTLNITTLDQFNDGIKKALTARSLPENMALVEQMVKGNEFRILVTREKVLAVMHRVPANVEGDGTHTIKELVDIKNQNPMRADNEDALYRSLRLDEIALSLLKEQGYTPETILPAHQKAFLRVVSNLSQGGDGVDVTDETHDSVKNIALNVIRAIPGLELAGLDFMCQDITAEQTPDSYAIIEVNVSAELAIHDHPLIGGRKRNVCYEFLKLMFTDLPSI